MSTEFKDALLRHQKAFGLELPQTVVERLDEFYRLIRKENPILHLVGKCDEEEFAIRHVLESVYLLTLTGSRTFADVGTGAGLPGIPCLIASDKLKGYLIESKKKKSGYLERTVEELGLADRCKIINRQFSEIKKPNAGVVVTRALDKLVQRLPQLIQWSGRSTIAIFSGEAVRNELLRLKIEFDEFLIPLSEKRFIFLVHEAKRRRR